MIRPPPTSPLFPSPPPSRPPPPRAYCRRCSARPTSRIRRPRRCSTLLHTPAASTWHRCGRIRRPPRHCSPFRQTGRSEEHTSELQSRSDLVCRLLLEKKKKI